MLQCLFIMCTKDSCEMGTMKKSEKSNARKKRREIVLFVCVHCLTMSEKKNFGKEKKIVLVFFFSFEECLEGQSVRVTRSLIHMYIEFFLDFKVDKKKTKKINEWKETFHILPWRHKSRENLLLVYHTFQFIQQCLFTCSKKKTFSFYFFAAFVSQWFRTWVENRFFFLCSLLSLLLFYTYIQTLNHQDVLPISVCLFIVKNISLGIECNGNGETAKSWNCLWLYVYRP